VALSAQFSSVLVVVTGARADRCKLLKLLKALAPGDDFGVGVDNAMKDEGTC
jgi:hypothetical protein